MVRKVGICKRRTARSVGIQLMMMTSVCSRADHKITKLELYCVLAIAVVTGFITDPTKLIRDRLINIASPTFFCRRMFSFQMMKIGRNT